MNKLEKPYYMVTFISRLKQSQQGYEEAASQMLKQVQEKEGFLGLESLRNSDGYGITVSFWADRNAIENWKNDEKHKAVQERAALWYESYSIHVGVVDI